jgi:hypothetical protein
VAKSKKASLVKELKSKGIDIPSKVTVETLESLLQTSEGDLGGKGYVVRLLKPYTRLPKHAHVINSLKETYWLPNSLWAEEVISSQILAVITRCERAKAPKGVRVIEVPREYHDRNE